ncbi:MAG: hypothetical protein K0S32_4248, partial [Bacteroidetes bacterium]|nr:hypothetical protein [Bacteroidota bacterium]
MGNIIFQIPLSFGYKTKIGVKFFE